MNNEELEKIKQRYYVMILAFIEVHGVNPFEGNALKVFIEDGLIPTIERAYDKGFENGLKHKKQQTLKIRQLRKAGKSYGEIKKELGIKWTNSVVHALKGE